MRVFLYLGVRTTGGIDLQRALYANRQVLGDAGVILPRTGFRVPHAESNEGDPAGHVPLAQAINSPTVMSRANYYRKALIHELLTSGSETAIISCENFLDPVQGLSPARVRSVLDSIGTVCPVIYLRRQDIYADALYRQLLCAPDRRLGHGFDRFVRGFLGHQWLDYASRIGPWVQEFGAENVIVRSFDDVTRHGPPIADLLGLCSDFDPATLKMPGADPPALLDPSLVNVIRAVNGFDHRIPKAKHDIIWELTHDEYWKSHPADTLESLVDDDLWNELRGEYADANDELIQSYVTGPGDRLRFEPTRLATRVAQQRFSVAEARILAVERWPGLSAEPAQTSAQELVDVTFQPSASVPENEQVRVGITALIKAPVTQITSWINFHLNAGFDHIALFVDGPPFYDELRSITNVTVVNCDEEFWRNLQVIAPQILDQKLRPIRQLGHELLVAKGMDWTAGIDGDELLCGDLHKALTQLPSDIDSVRVWPAEAVQHSGMEPIDGFESRVFKIKPNDDHRRIRAARDAHGAINDVSLFGFFGHTQGKSIVRAAVAADVWGSHNVINTQHHLETVPLKAAVLLHFESRPFDEWRQRWADKLDSDNEFTFFSQYRFNQYRLLDEAFQSGDDALRELYERWFFMEDDRIAKLEVDGLVERIRIPSAAFCSPRDPSR